jgi:hypothetical protein
VTAWRIPVGAVRYGAVLTALHVGVGVRAHAQIAHASASRVVASISEGALPSSSLSVRDAGSWRTWWRATDAPTRWAAPDSTLVRSLRWAAEVDGIASAEAVLAGQGEAWRTRLIVIRIDPTRVTLALDTAFGGVGGADWTLDRAPSAAVFAVNGGQFVRTMPWGWVQLDGRQVLAPGSGPLVSTIGIDDAGRVHWSSHGEPLRERMRWGFQSYPALLDSGAVPAPLQREGLGVDVAHRDARLALGRTRDGQLIVAMTRFDALGARLGFVPFGLTTPEMAAIMGALGAQDAVLLDGGISAQLLVRGRGGVRRWNGLRAVPLALIARRKQMPGKQ